MDKPCKLILTIYFILIVVACGCKRSLSEEEKQELAGVQQDLKSVKEEIEKAKQDDALYSGGLVKALIAVRLEILKTNEALLQQRIYQIESGAPVETKVALTKPDPARAAELEKELAQQKLKIEVAQAESDKWAGGLVKAMAETTLATERQTLAMLHQQYLSAKYGLLAPVIITPEAPKENRDEKDSPL